MRGRPALAALIACGVAAGCSRGTPTAPAVEGVQALLLLQRAPQAIAGSVTEPIVRRSGAMLYRLQPAAPQGERTALVQEGELGSPVADVDILHPELDFEGKTVVFSMSLRPGDPFHVYTVGIDGAGLRQVTFEPGTDELDPTWLADGRIAFSAAALVPDESGRREAMRLHAVRADGTGRTQLSYDLSLDRSTSALGDGRILFSRWEHLGGRSSFALFALRPDTGDAVALGGNHGPAASWLWARETPDGKIVAVATSRTRTFDAGALVLVDPALGDAANAVSLTPEVPQDRSCSPGGRFRHPWPLGGDRYLVAWAEGCVSEEDEANGVVPDFGIYVYDAGARTLRPVFNDPAASDLHPIPIAPRSEPRAWEPAATDPAASSGAWVLGAANVHDTGLLFGPLPGTARSVRLVEGLGGGAAGAREASRSEHEPKAVLGEVPVFADGSFVAEVPARTPLQVQPLDEFGLALGSPETWLAGEPGEVRVCTGCHSDRAPLEGPASTAALAARAEDPAPFVVNPPLDRRRELDFRAVVQPVLDRRCALGGCHDATTAAGGYTTLALTVQGLDLSALTRGAFTASYLSLLFEDGVLRADGTLVRSSRPWVRPGSARGSLVVQKVNVRSRLDPARWAFGSAPHPEDVTGGGVSPTDEERQTIAAWIDLGAPFASRRFAGPVDRVFRRWTFDEAMFASTIQPLLWQSCAQAGGGCHAYDEGRAAELLEFNLTNGPGPDGAEGEGDLSAAADFVDPESPDTSWLLTKPQAGVAAHEGGDLFAAGDPAYEQLLAWIRTAAPRGQP